MLIETDEQLEVTVARLPQARTGQAATATMPATSRMSKRTKRKYSENIALVTQHFLYLSTTTIKGRVQNNAMIE